MHADLGTPTFSTSLPISGPLTLGELLDRAFRLYRSRFRTFILIAGVFYLPYSLLSGFVTGNFVLTMFSAMEMVLSEPTALEQPSDAFVGMASRSLGLTMLVSILGWLLVIFVGVALTSQALCSLRGVLQSVGQSLRSALRSFRPAIGMQILWVLALGALIMGLAIAAGVAFMIITVTVGGVASFFSESQGFGAGVAFVGMFLLLMCLYAVGLLAFLVPFVFLSARWMVALPGIVDQRWRGAESLRGSWRLTRGFALRCSGYLVLLWVLNGVITTVPGYLAQAFLVIVLPQSSLPLITALSSVTSALLSMIWQPLYAIAIVLLYFDLRVRREGYDITLRVESMEAELRAAQARSEGGPGELPDLS